MDRGTDRRCALQQPFLSSPLTGARKKNIEGGVHVIRITLGTSWACMGKSACDERDGAAASSECEGQERKWGRRWWSRGRRMAIGTLGFSMAEVRKDQCGRDA